MSPPKYQKITHNILQWYEEHGKDLPWRKTHDLFKILISEIFLKKTNTTSVKDIYDEFFEKYHGFEDLHETNVEELKSDIKSLGLSNRRSRTLKSLARWVVQENDGKLPRDLSRLKEVKGIGEYVARALKCFGSGKRVLFQDVNIRRVIHRVFRGEQGEEGDDFVEEKLDLLVPKENVKDFYWGILDLGSKVGQKIEPRCDECPISRLCHEHSQGH